MKMGAVRWILNPRVRLSGISFPDLLVLPRTISRPGVYPARLAPRPRARNPKRLLYPLKSCPPGIPRLWVLLIVIEPPVKFFALLIRESNTISLFIERVPNHLH